MVSNQIYTRTQFCVRTVLCMKSLWCPAWKSLWKGSLALPVLWLCSLESVCFYSLPLHKMVLALPTMVFELNRGCDILRTDQAVALKFFPVTPVCHIHRLRGPRFATGQRSSDLCLPTPTTISGVLWLQPIIPYQLLTTQGSFALEPYGIDKQGLPYSMQQQDRGEAGNSPLVGLPMSEIFISDRRQESRE